MDISSIQNDSSSSKRAELYLHCHGNNGEKEKLGEYAKNGFIVPTALLMRTRKRSNCDFFKNGDVD